MGRQASEGGSALANAVFLSHGTKPRGGPPAIFESLSEMEEAGFTARYGESLRADLALLTADERLVFKGLSVAMISYVFVASSYKALKTMRRDNTSKFRNGLGPSLLQSTVDCGLFSGIEPARSALLSYTDLADSSSVPVLFNMEKPASGDLLEDFILKSIERSGAKARYGVARTGITGFDIVAVPLMEGVSKAITDAVQQYHW